MEHEQKRKIGRPKAPEGEKQDKVIKIMATKRDRDEMKARATSLGLNVADYFRMLYVNDRSKNEQKNNG